MDFNAALNLSEKKQNNIHNMDLSKKKINFMYIQYEILSHDS